MLTVVQNISLHTELISPFTWLPHSSQHTSQQRFGKIVSNLFVKLLVWATSCKKKKKNLNVSFFFFFFYLSWIHFVLSLEHIAHPLLCESDAVGGHRLVYFYIYPRAFPVSKRKKERKKETGDGAVELSEPKTINCHVAVAQSKVPMWPVA